MEKLLHKEELDEIFEKIKFAYSDVSYISFIEDKLISIINDANNYDFGRNSKLSTNLKNYFDLSLIDESDINHNLLKLIMNACFLLVYMHKVEMNTKPLLWDSTSKLLHEYPEFIGQNIIELEYLLNFRNFIAICLQIIPAHRNKTTLLKIGGRFEGSKSDYIKGGGQKSEVNRRELIIEREGGTQTEKRKKIPSSKSNSQIDKNKKKVKSYIPKSKRLKIDENSINILQSSPKNSDCTLEAKPNNNIFTLNLDIKYSSESKELECSASLNNEVPKFNLSKPIRQNSLQSDHIGPTDEKALNLEHFSF